MVSWNVFRNFKCFEETKALIKPELVQCCNCIYQIVHRQWIWMTASWSLAYAWSVSIVGLVQYVQLWLDYALLRVTCVNIIVWLNLLPNLSNRGKCRKPEKWKWKSYGWITLICFKYNWIICNICVLLI